MTIIGGALLAGALLTGCDSRAKLCESIQGEWTGNPERLLDTGAATASLVRVLEFTEGSTDCEGTVTMMAMITVENAVQRFAGVAPADHRVGNRHDHRRLSGQRRR